MIIPMLCVTIFVILVVWFLLPRVARLMIHTPTAISIFVCLSMVQLMAVFISMRCRSEERFSRNAETDLVCRLLLEKNKGDHAPDTTLFAGCLQAIDVLGREARGADHRSHPRRHGRGRQLPGGGRHCEIHKDLRAPFGQERRRVLVVAEAPRIVDVRCGLERASDL